MEAVQGVGLKISHVAHSIIPAKSMPFAGAKSKAT